MPNDMELSKTIRYRKRLIIVLIISTILLLPIIPIEGKWVPSCLMPGVCKPYEREWVSILYVIANYNNGVQLDL
jgi:hypothetical protein